MEGLRDYSLLRPNQRNIEISQCHLQLYCWTKGSYITLSQFFPKQGFFMKFLYMCSEAAMGRGGGGRDAATGFARYCAKKDGCALRKTHYSYNIYGLVRCSVTMCPLCEKCDVWPLHQVPTSYWNDSAYSSQKYPNFSFGINFFSWMCKPRTFSDLFLHEAGLPFWSSRNGLLCRLHVFLG